MVGVLVSQRHGAHTVLTGLLDRSTPLGVLAEIEALGLNFLELLPAFRRKLLLGLFHLHAAGLLPRDYRVIGSASARSR